MKKFLLIASVFLTIAVTTTAAQDIKIDDVKTPPSPAFVLMGIEPSAVERPTTPRALGASLLSALNDESSPSSPKNFALEVAPYWLTSHPKLTYDQYNQPDFGQALLQSLSVSVATKQQTAGSDATPGSTLGGAGVRTAWLLGKPSSIEGQLRTAIQNLAADLAAKAPPMPGQPPPDPMNDPTFTKLIDAFRNARYEGRWFIEAAAASTALFTDNNAEKSQHQKSGVWVTPSYRMSRTSFDSSTNTVTSQPNIDFLAVVRWISDHTGTERTSPLDLGARLLWNNGDLSISAEHVERRRTSKNSSRTAAVGEFKLSDNMYLTATFGKNFKDENPKGTLIGIFGLHFGIGSKPVLSP